MRWDQLFADLEGQYDAAESEAFMASVAEFTRAERASVDLASRLAAARGEAVTVTLRSGHTLAGTLTEAAAAWALLVVDGRQHLIPLSSIGAVAGLGARASDLSVVERRLSLGHALRALARDRARVVVAVGESAYTGMIGAVGKDHVDIGTGGGRVMTVPFAAIDYLRSAEL